MSDYPSPTVRDLTVLGTLTGVAMPASGSSATPLVDGTAAAGAALTWSRSDHVHPFVPAIGRNLLHNPYFAIAQRGAGPFTTNVYTADRWVIGLSLDSVSQTVATLADADRAAIGDESAAAALQNVFVGNAGAGALNVIGQRIEGVRRLAGLTVTVSFWAKAAAGTPKFGVSLDQNFGTGGSPSAQVNGTGSSVTLSTTWARYSVTLTIASIAGKTLGTAGNDYTQLNLWYSAGATAATRSGTVGVQSATISLWGVQLEVAAAATPLEKIDPATDLAHCKRFACSASFTFGGYAPGGATNFYGAAYLPVALRAAPTASLSGLSYSNASAAATDALLPNVVQLHAVTAAAGNAFASGTIFVTADL